MCVCVFLCIKSLTCSVDVKVGGFVGDAAHRFDSWAFDRDLGGVAQRFVHVHLKWTFGNRLACKQHRHLGNRNNSYPEICGGIKEVFLNAFHYIIHYVTCLQKILWTLPCEAQ